MSAPWQMSDAEIDAAFAGRSTDPRERQIDQIVADTGMDRLQAHYHLQGRRAVMAQLDRQRRERLDQAYRSLASEPRPIGEIVQPIVANLRERAK